MSQNTALLLSGGGAKAAYQAGVLKGILSFYKQKKSPFNIICGNSAGAINSVILGCFNSEFKTGVDQLNKVWSNIKTDDIYSCTYPKVIMHILKMLSRYIKSENAVYDGASLLNNIPLNRLISQNVDFNLIDKQIYSGNLKAISVSCSCYSTNKLTVFFQSKDCNPWNESRHNGQKININIKHLMASSAIPLIFPSVQIKRDYFGDGIVNQHAPLSAPIQLGADKIFIIHLEQNKNQPKQMNRHPTSANIASHILGKIFSDVLHTDHERLLKTNDMVQAMSAESNKTKLKKIDSLILKPSVNIDSIAKECYQDMPKAIRTLYRILGINEENSINLIAYLLFEKSFCNKLIKTGIKDAIDNKTKIMDFIS